MEGINKESLKAVLVSRTEQDRLNEEAKRRKEELERLRGEQERRSRQERHEAYEREARQTVFELVGKKPFNTAEPIAITSRYYDQDEGIGHSEDIDWSFLKDGEVVICSKESTRNDFGWSGSRVSHDSSVWLFAADIDRPLLAKAPRAAVLKYGLPVNTQAFDPDSWISLRDNLEGLKQTVLEKEMLERSEALLEKYGVRERNGFTPDGKRIPDQGAWDRVVLQAPGEDQSVWRLIRRNDPFNGELQSYAIDYSDLATKAGFQIELSPDNLRPYIRTYMQAPGLSYGEVRARYLELFQQGIRAIEKGFNPTLFDAENIA